MILSSLRKAIREEGLLPLGASCVLAVSGGADSFAMLHAMAQLTPDHDWNLRVITLNHGMRPESARECELVARRCETLEIPCEIFRRSGSPPTRHAASFLRNWRRKTLMDQSQDKDFIATAHTATDRAETLLMNLIRGTGLDGLGALPPRNGKWIRPMLNFSRQDLRQWLRDQNLSWVDDPTNEDVSKERVWVRKTVLPLLESRRQGATGRLSHTAGVVSKDRGDLWALASKAYSQLAAEEDLGVVFPASPIREEVDAVTIRMVLIAWQKQCHWEGPIPKWVWQQATLLVTKRKNATFPKGLRGYHFKGNLGIGPAPVIYSPGAINTVTHQEVSGPWGHLKWVSREGGLPPGEWIWRPRGYGDSFGKKGRSLKKMLYRATIPPWRRWEPVLARESLVVWTPSLGVAPEFIVPDGERGGVPVWHQKETQ